MFYILFQVVNWSNELKQAAFRAFASLGANDEEIRKKASGFSSFDKKSYFLSNACHSRYIKFHVLNFFNQFFAIIEIVYCLGNNAFDLWNMNRSLRQRTWWSTLWMEWTAVTLRFRWEPCGVSIASHALSSSSEPHSRTTQCGNLLWMWVQKDSTVIIKWITAIMEK